jgi:hypothetical protein
MLVVRCYFEFTASEANPGNVWGSPHVDNVFPASCVLVKPAFQPVFELILKVRHQLGGEYTVSLASQLSAKHLDKLVVQECGTASPSCSSGAFRNRQRILIFNRV